jgi:putative inorganic carbon (hco3(-)) transporter
MAAPYPARPALPSRPQAAQNPMAAIGTKVLLVYLFLVMSRVLDLLPGLSVLRLPLILMVILLVLLVASGAFAQSLANTGVRLALALFAWAAVSTVFSVWRTGSLDFMKDLFLLVAVFLAIVTLVQTADDLRRVVAVQMAAITVASLMSFFARGEDTRLALSGGSYWDPNGFAAAILQAMPLCFLYQSRLHRPLTKFLAMATLLPMLVAFLRTGSRGGMIAFVLMGVMLFFRVSILKKVALLVLGGVLAVVALFLLPESLRVRYMTLFGTSQEARTDLDLGGAASSSEARLALLQLSVQLTLQNPVFGVGPGMFPVAGDMEAKSEGRPRGTWQVTHNTYTQVSSELGIPGLLLFLGLMWQGWRCSRSLGWLNQRQQAPQLDSLRQIGSVLQFSFLGFSISVFFLSLFFWMTWAILIASMICVDRLAKQELGPVMPRPKPGPSPGPVARMRLR